VLPLYTRPLSYYWNQWYGAEGVVLIDEAKVRKPLGMIHCLADEELVLLGSWHYQSIWRHVHLSHSHLECNEATYGSHSKDRHMLHVSTW
jgi:hypothetical protein